MLVLILLSFLVGDKKLSSKPEKTNAVSLSNAVKITDDDLGFYKSIDADVSPDGYVVVLDRGNFQIVVFDKAGKKKVSFGKEGNGPGELGSYPGSIQAFKKSIILQNFDRLLIFDYDGNLTGDIREQTYGSTISESKDGIRLFYNLDRNPKLLEQLYGFDGKLIKESKNKDYKEDENNRTLNSFVDQYEERFKQPIGFEPFNQNYVQWFQGSYKFQIVNDKSQPLTVLTRSFTRVEDKNTQPPVQISTSNSSKKQQEEIKKMIESMTAKKIKMTGGYKNDIGGVAGTHNGFLFLRTATAEEGTIELDVISSDLNYYTQLHLEEKDLRYVSVNNGKLIMEMENDDIGPYVKVMDLEIN